MFDVAGAKAAGYSDAEIQQFLMSMPETAEAKQAGYSDAEIFQHFGLEAAPQKPSESLTAERAAEVAGGAIAPIAAAAGLGGLVGGPVGAVAAPAALGVADLATTLYNIAAPKIGTSQVRTPSDIARQYLTPQSFRPRTQAEELIAAGVEGLGGAVSGAGAANVFAKRAAPGLMRNVLATMGERPLVQAGAGAGAAVAPVRAEQMGIEDPRALLATSLVGGLAGARGAAGLQQTAESALAAGQRGALRVVGKPPSTEALGERASQSFEKATSLGVQYDPQAYQSFSGGLESSLKGYDPDFSKFADVKVAVNKLKDLDSQPLTIERLHNARQMLGVLRGDKEKDVRRMAGILTDKLDDFVTNEKNTNIPARITGAGQEAADALMSGIKDYKMMSKSAEIERLIERADLVGGSAENIETQFRVLARNPARLRRFTEDEQAMIKRIAKGQEGSSLANFASMLSPTRSPAMLASQALVGGYGLSSEDPYAIYGAGGAALAGATGRAVRNALARRAAGNVAAMTRGAPTAVPFSVEYAPIAAPIATQGINAMAR
jgi:hypothetical protein